MISPLSATGAQASASPTSLTSNPVTEKDFLVMLTAELTNQDPLKPVSGTKFVSELAQFTSLSAITTLQQQEATVEGAAMIGKTVQVGTQSGVVQSARVHNGQVTLNVHGFSKPVPLTSITGILS